MVGGMRVVKFTRPRRQFAEVIGAADEAASLVVEPECRVGHVARGQNRAAILHRDPDHTRFAAIGDLQLIAHRAYQQPVRRGPAFTRTAQNLHCFIRNAGDRFARLTIEPVVADDAADRWRGAAHECAVADRRDRRKVLVVRVAEHRAPRQQAVQALLVLRPESQQIVIAELIHRNGHHQLRLVSGGGGRDGESREKECERSFH